MDQLFSALKDEQVDKLKAGVENAATNLGSSLGQKLVDADLRRAVWLATESLYDRFQRDYESISILVGFIPIKISFNRKKS